MVHERIAYGPLVKRPKTPPFHGGNTGSNPVRVTNLIIRLGFDRLVIDHASVAQSVEQRTENPRVGGSIPS